MMTSHHNPLSGGGSPARHTQRPADLMNEVASLVRDYESLTSASPALSIIFRDPPKEDLFLEVFTHHLKHLKTRSHQLKDGRMTIYDKALLELTNNGTQTRSLGAFELYLDEVLGISQHGDIREVETILDKEIALHALLLKVAGPSPRTPKSSPPANVPYPPNPQDDLLEVENTGAESLFYPDACAEELPSINSPRDPAALTQLLRTYQQAKIDYLTLPKVDDRQKYLAARFLRDTAENCIALLDSMAKPDQALMSELKITCAKATETATALSGGKKRKFDNDDGNKVSRNSNLNAGGLEKDTSGKRNNQKTKHGDKTYGRKYVPRSDVGGHVRQGKVEKDDRGSGSYHSERKLDSYVPGRTYRGYGDSDYAEPEYYDRSYNYDRDYVRERRESRLPYRGPSYSRGSGC